MCPPDGSGSKLHPYTERSFWPPDKPNSRTNLSCFFFKFFILFTQFEKWSDCVIRLENGTLTILRNLSFGSNPVKWKSVIRKVFNRHGQTFPLSSHIYTYSDFRAQVIVFGTKQSENTVYDWLKLYFVFIDIIRCIIGVGIETQY